MKRERSVAHTFTCTSAFVDMRLLGALMYILPRDAMHKRGICRHAVSVCLSVCLSRSWIMSKRINMSSKHFHRRVATPFLFFHTKRGGDIPTGTPLNGGVECKGV